MFFQILEFAWATRDLFPSTLVPRYSSFFGGHKAVVRPDPIPNSAVKHSLADGSGLIDSARVGRRQFFKKADAKKFASAFSFLALVKIREIRVSGSRSVVLRRSY